MPYDNTTSRSTADRLSYKQDDGGSIPSSSTVAEVEVDDTPGCGPGGNGFESRRSPHRCGGSGDQRGVIGHAWRVRFPLPLLIHGPAAIGSDGSLARRRLWVRLPPGPRTRSSRK